MRHVGVLIDPMSQWGEEALGLQFAGCHYQVSGLTRRQSQRLRDRYHELVSAPAQTSLSVALTVHRDVSVGDLQPDVQRAAAFERDGIYMPELQRVDNQLFVRGLDFSIELQLHPHMSGVVRCRNELRLCDPAVFENVLRIAAAYTSVCQQGLFLHSAGIVVDDCAWLFLGRSGAGKSTISRRAVEAGHALLSDDCNIVLPAGSGFEAAAVPFAGELADSVTTSAHSHPVGGLVWLQQSERLSLQPLSAALQFARVLACCPVVNVDSQHLDQVSPVIESVLRRVPMQALNFRCDEPFAAIASVLTGAERVSA